MRLMNESIERNAHAKGLEAYRCFRVFDSFCLFFVLYGFFLFFIFVPFHLRTYFVTLCRLCIGASSQTGRGLRGRFVTLGKLKYWDYRTGGSNLNENEGATLIYGLSELIRISVYTVC